MQTSGSGIRHVRVYYQDGDFAAWPANHGIWSWGNEILVGFQAARHLDSTSHTWDPATSLHKFARSLDGGETWTIEDAYEQGITALATGHALGDLAQEPRAFDGEMDFTHPDFAFTFRRRTDTVGPSMFYYSYDRGKSWEGPFAFPDLETAGVATRTAYVIEGPLAMTVFLTTAKGNGDKGWAACARTVDGGKTWERLSMIGPEPQGQAIMPAAVRLSASTLLVVLRRTASLPAVREWLAVYRSEDNGLTWAWIGDPVDNVGWNSNPPTLIKLQDGRLCLTYAIRGGATAWPASRLGVRFSSDEGGTWGDEVVLRGGDGANRDVGYTRAVQRPDGKVVVVYYYNHALDTYQTPYRYIAATIFDPALMIAEQPEAASRFLGGGRDGWDRQTMAAFVGLGGPQVTLSSGTDQVFDFTDGNAALATLVIAVEEPQGTITNGGTLRIGVPPAWRCRFDTGVTPVLGGNAVGKTGVAAYADGGRTLEIPVTADFANDDTLTVSGLKLVNLRLMSADTQRLELDFTGNGVRDVYDLYAVQVRVAWPGGTYDGWGRQATDDYFEIKPPSGMRFIIR